LLPFTSHCSTKHISFNDYGYVIKPPQQSSAIYGAPPFTGNPLHTLMFTRLHISMGQTRFKGFVSASWSVNQKVPVGHSVSQHSPT